MSPPSRTDHTCIILWLRRGYRQNLNSLWHFTPREDVGMCWRDAGESRMTRTSREGGEKWLVARAWALLVRG